MGVEMNCKKVAMKHEVTDGEKELVAQIAKTSLGFMSKNGIPITPRNFEEWFYIICKAKEENHLLTPKNLKVLYEKYFKDIPQLEDVEEIKEISFNLRHLTLDSEEALDKFESNLNSHNSYIQESITAIDENDIQKMEYLKTKIHTLEEENNKLKKFLEENRKKLDFIEEKFNEQKREADHDALTGLLNRRSFDRDITQLHESQVPYSLVICDIDDFKKINDTYGHLVGDKVLKEVGEILTNYVRNNTRSYRYGGEEFVVLLPNADENAAKVVGERLREVIENRTIQINSARINFTASFGGTKRKEGDDIASVIGRADKALYEAKKSGKNRVVIYG